MSTRPSTTPPFAWARRSRQASAACAIAVVMLGVALLAAGRPAALVLVVAGVALIVIREPSTRARRGAGAFLGAVVSLAAVVVAVRAVQGHDAGLGPLPVAGLVLGGLGLLLADAVSTRAVAPGQPLGLAAVAAGAYPLLEALYAGVEPGAVAHPGRLAFAAAVVLLGAGLTLSRPRHGVVVLLGAADAAGGVLRRALIPAVIALVLVGAFAAGLRERIGMASAIALLVLAGIAVVTVLTWSSAARLRRLAAEQASSARRQKSLGQQLSTVLESLAQGFLAFDRAGRLVHVNRRAARMLRGEPEALIGRRAWELFDGHPEGRLDRSIARALQENVPITVQAEYAALRLWCEIDIVPAGDGVILFAQDVTERRLRDQERQDLLDSERAARADAQRTSRLKDEFLATVSHELRTPLNAILGWAQVLARSGGEEPQRRGLAAIERNALLQAQLIDDLLDVSRIISGKLRLDLRPVELQPIVESAVDTVRHSADDKGVQLVRELDAAGVVVQGDPARLQQVVWNLVSNAVKFTPTGGEVRVTLVRDGAWARLAVRDTGQGLRPETLPQIFGRFWQADVSTTRTQSGLGLGLAIVQHLVEQHEGTVTAASEGEGHGSTFTVSLPVAAAHGERVTREDRTPDAVPDGPSLAGVSVLVVDDEPDSRELIRHVLEQHGAEVREASSAVMALNLFTSRRPDVLISDIGMPGADGYELIGLVRAFEGDARPRVPAIALTAFARPEDRRRAFLSGFELHVVKPVIPSELVQLVASLAGRSGTHDSVA